MAVEKSQKSLIKFQENEEFGWVLLLIISAIGKTDVAKFSEELATPPIAQNKAIFEGNKFPTKVETLKNVP